MFVEYAAQHGPPVQLCKGSDQCITLAESIILRNDRIPTNIVPVRIKIEKSTSWGKSNIRRVHKSHHSLGNERLGWRLQ